MTDKERIKLILEPKKENILKAFRNRTIYKTWDKHSPIWVYYKATCNVEEITDIKTIEYVLKWKNPYIYCSFNKEDVDTYKWLIDFINVEVKNAIMKDFDSAINDFVYIKGLSLGDKNIYGEI